MTPDVYVVPSNNGYQVRLTVGKAQFNVGCVADDPADAHYFARQLRRALNELQPVPAMTNAIRKAAQDRLTKSKPLKVNNMDREQLTKVRDALSLWFNYCDSNRSELAYEGNCAAECLNILDSELAKPEPEPEPEPVGEVVRYIFGTYEGIRFSILPAGMLLQIGTKLYTAPPAAKPWVGLTDEEMLPEIKKCANYYGYINKPMHLTAGAGFFGLARAIEDALRAKNLGEQA